MADSTRKFQLLTFGWKNWVSSDEEILTYDPKPEVDLEQNSTEPGDLEKVIWR